MKTENATIAISTMHKAYFQYVLKNNTNVSVLDLHLLQYK